MLALVPPPVRRRTLAPAPAAARAAAPVFAAPLPAARRLATVTTRAAASAPTGVHGVDDAQRRILRTTVEHGGKI